MDKKVWIALILSMGVLFFYPYLIKWYYPEQPAPIEQTAQTAAPVQAVATAAPGAPAPAKPEAQKPVAEELTTVETPLYRAVFSNLGGGVKSLELKNYHQDMNNPRVVNVASKVAVQNSFRSQFDINGVTETPVFKPSSTSLNLEGAARGELVYTGSLSNGLAIEKKVIFSGDAYIIDTEIKAVNGTQTAVSVRADTVLNAPVSGKDDTGYHQGPIVKANDKLVRQADDERTLSGNSKFKWIGLEDKYFLAAIVPVTDAQYSWVAEVPGAGSSRATLQYPVNLAPGGSARWISYVPGPKEYDDSP
jgi:YidC/Oxa1 family membrane protein insertase